MANCNSLTLNGIGMECAKAVGGVKAVYIALKSDVTGVALDSNGASITGITAQDGAFKTYLFHKNTASMSTETEAPDDDFPQFNTTVSMVFSRMNAAKRVEMMAMALNDTVAIVETVEGTKFYLGYNMGLIISALAGETGTVYSDKNQYTISLIDHAEQLPYPVVVESAAWNKLIADAPAA